MADADPVPPPRARSARGEGGMLRDHLVAATVARLEAEGDAARVSVRAIARAAGVSPTALYLHFPDRDALVSAAVDRGFAAFNEAILAGYASTDEPVARLRAMGLAYLDFVERQPALYTVIFSARREAERAGPDGNPVDRGEALVALVSAVAAAVPAGARAEARPLALTFWAALHGYGTLSSRSGVGDWPTPEAYVGLLLRAHLGAGEPG